MNLERIAEIFREKGLTKQAALLETKAGKMYVLALSHVKWQRKLAESLRENDITFMEDPIDKCLTDQDSRRRFTELQLHLDLIVNFEPHQLDMSPLEIKVKGNVTAEDIKISGEICETLDRLRHKGYQILQKELKEVAYDDEDLLYEIYKDGEKSRYSRNHFYDRIFRRVENAVESIAIIEKLAPPFILAKSAEVIHEMMGPGNPEIKSLFKKIQEYNNEIENQNETHEKFNTAYLELIKEAHAVIEKEKNDPGSTEHLFQAWVEEMKSTERERIIKQVRESLRYEYIEYDIEDVCFNLEGAIEGTCMVDNVCIESGEKPYIDRLIKALMKSPIQCRQSFLDEIQFSQFDSVRKSLIGFKQILEGGPVTNPEVPKVSSMQNHAGFANIRYSDATKKELESIVDQMDDCFSRYPDISALPTPSKLKRKRQLQYVMEELPKDPLDVTFGNDSACCIFVSDDKNEIQNGMFIPSYLLHPEVRIFGIYRVDENKRQRMGMVLAFETGYEEGREGKVLSCNSLEISRLGIAGGNDTVEKIVNYAEDWLAKYGQENGYEGVSMGNHSYNTSVNYSSRKGDIVEDTLVFRNIVEDTPVFRKFPLQFFSDILKTKNDESMVTRKYSCYWLWKKQ
jgi:hypothetical protein